MKRAKVFLLDDHPLICERMAELINQQTDLVVGGTADSLRSALAGILAEKPDLAIVDLIKDTNRLAEAEPLLRRALTIIEQSHGPYHPDIAAVLNKQASLLRRANQLTDAEQLMHRAVIILCKFRESTGHEHPHMQEAISNYRSLLQAMQLPDEEIQRRINDGV